MAGLAEQPRGRRRRRLRGFCPRVKGQKFQRCRRARHGRIEPRAGSAGGDVRARSPASRSCTCSIPPTRAGARDGEPVDLAHTLFIVSSKSGGTTEPNVMKDYFFDRVSKAIGKDKAGHRFIAVTDPGSTLQRRSPRRTGLSPHLPWRAHDRRTLFRAVAVRPGAGGGRPVSTFAA